MSSSLTIQATYRGGMLEPRHPLPFGEGEDVELTITRKSAVPQPNPAFLLAEIAKLPTVGGDPMCADNHDRILYGKADAS